MARGSAQNAKGNKANNQPASAKGAGSHLRANKGHEAEFDEFEPLVEPSANRDIAGVVIAVLAIASFIAVISPATAPVTAAVAGFYHLGFGLGAYVLPIVILLFATTLFLGEDSPLNIRSVAGGAVVFVAIVSNPVADGAGHERFVRPHVYAAKPFRIGRLHWRLYRKYLAKRPG